MFSWLRGTGPVLCHKQAFLIFQSINTLVFFVCLFLTSKNVGEIWGLGGMVLTVKKEILHVGTAIVALLGQHIGPFGVVKLVNDLQQGNTRGHHRNRVSWDLT